MFDFNEFYSGLLSNKYVTDDYLEQYPQSRKQYKNEILNLLDIALQHQNPEKLRAVVTLADLDGVDVNYTSVLLTLLKQYWHDSYEDIVMLLSEIKDPATIEILYEIALNNSSDDEFRSLAKKAIWALGAIDTADAYHKLRLLKDSKDQVISETAIKQLEHKAK